MLDFDFYIFLYVYFHFMIHGVSYSTKQVPFPKNSDKKAFTES